MKRKSPTRHTVHTRHRRYKVRFYSRGKGKKSDIRARRRVVRKTPVVNILKYPKNIFWNTVDTRYEKRIINPMKFLSLTAPPVSAEHLKKKNFSGMHRRITDLEEDILKENGFYPVRLSILPSGQVVDHDGRHRAIIAIKSRWTTIPVEIWCVNRSDEVLDSRECEKVSLKKLIPQRTKLHADAVAKAYFEWRKRR